MIHLRPTLGPYISAMSTGILFTAITAGLGLGALHLARSRRPDVEVAAIQKRVRWHERKGAVVLADIAGYAKPPKLYGHIPDIYAIYDWGIFIEEFENEQSIVGRHARSQDNAFRRWARRAPGRMYKQVLVVGGKGGRC